MPIKHPHLQKLLKCIELEEAEEIKRYSLDQQHTLKSLKAEGLAIHPITVTRKNFGYADYPEISFKINFPFETNHFKDGAAIECFLQGEETIKGVLINLNGKSGEFRLFAPDFPDWIEDNGVGIKLSPDQRTTSIMKETLNNLEANKILAELFDKIHTTNHTTNSITPSPLERAGVRSPALSFKNKNLNESQHKAVGAILANEAMTIVHGPPGTGKTTTLIEAIFQLIQKGEKVLVSAPSNTAVDNIAKGLLQNGIKILRVGNSSKVDDEVFKHTPEGRLSADAKQLKEIKDLKIRAEQFRRMALKYKRSFGKAEREQRNLLFKEVRAIRDEIKKIQAYNEEKLYTDAQVILGTPIGIYDSKISPTKFNSLVIDEAGQCLEPLAWCIFPMAEKFVLAGDHLQLPPTVLSQDAMRLGFNRSILEVCFPKFEQVYLLNTQYRMKPAIAGFSSNYFYEGKLLTALHLQNTHAHVTFIDTAGSGMNEQKGNDGSSLLNEGELQIIQKIIETENLNPLDTAIISPYSGQVTAAREQFPSSLRI
ncbi:MAG: hypothetical protein RL065_86, partial [Bacteroidota bacterium]